MPLSPEQGIASLRDRLRESTAAEVALLETHISWVLLTGEFAYKIKKPVDLGFVDFSTLEKRHHACLEELRLNGRLAPELYLDVVPITGTWDAPSLNGTGTTIEYAVRMRRFPDGALLSDQLAAGNVSARHIDGLAGSVAAFHRQTAIASPDSRFGTPEHVLRPVLESVDQLSFPEGDPLRRQVDEIRRWVQTESQRLQSIFLDRKHAGFIRECHGDMHLANMVLLDDRVLLFDCIEFNEDFRWIDVQSDVAFCVMDLEDRGRPDFAYRFLNAWLSAAGDYAGTQVLRFYLVYRALVRAKVCRLRQSQSGLDEAQRANIDEELHAYLEMATQKTRPRFPAVIITHGFSGSGKSSGTAQLLEHLGAIRVRSDVERKRLFQMRPVLDRNAHDQPTPATLPPDMYSAACTAKTYDALLEAARAIVRAGFPAIVDATFLREHERRRFRELARESQVPCLVLDFQARPQALKERVRRRERQALDVSDATVTVLEQQLKHAEPLTEDELALTIAVDTERPGAWDTLCEAVTHRLSR